MASRSGGVGYGPRLLGRREELAELSAGLDDARSGSGRLFLVVGEAGIGKTRLLEALVDRTEPTEVRTAWGRCWHPRAGGPFAPWVQVIGSCADELRPDELRRHLGAGAPDVARLVPAVARRLAAEVVHAAPSPSRDGRVRLFDSITAFLRSVASDGGLLVALDGLHVADEPSLRLLHHVAHRLEDSKVLLVGAYRDAEVRSAPHLHRLVAAIARRGRRIVLGGLDESDVATLLEATPGAGADAALVRQVHYLTDGNPLFTEAVGRRARSDPGTDVPEELHDLVATWLGSMPDLVHDVARVAAVVKRPFDLDLVQSTLGAETDEIIGALRQATEQGLLVEVGSGRWAFVHDLVGEGVHDRIRFSERVALHRRVAVALERLGGPPPDAHAFELAHHHYEAARSGDAAGALCHCAAAAELAMAVLAFEEAGIHYGRALEALALALPVDERERYRLLMGLVDVNVGLGDWDLARDFQGRALKSARALGSPELLARAAVRFAGEGQPVDSAAVSVLVEARAALADEDHPLLAQVLAALAAAADDADTAVHLAGQAHAMARRLADRDALLAVLWQWHDVNDDPDVADQRLAAADELVRLSDDAGDREGLQRARQRRALDLLATGAVAAMKTEIDLLRQEDERLRLPTLVQGTNLVLAALAVLQGDLEDAEHLVWPSIGNEPSGPPEADDRTFSLRSVLCREQGRFEDMAELARGRLRRAPDRIHALPHALLALALAELEKHEAAREALRPVVDELLRSRGADRLAGPALVAEVSWLAGEVAWAEPAYQRLAPAATRHVVLGTTASLGASDRHLGQLATLLGRLDEAEAHFEAAHRLHEGMGARGWLAHGKLDHARLLLARGRPGDASRAQELLDAARQTYRTLGMPMHERRATAVVEGPLLGGTGGTDAGLFSLAGEYWTIGYGGTEVQLRDSKGLRYLARLLRTPGQEVHALDLVVGEGGRSRASAGAVRQDGLATASGDAGAVLDATAKAAYKRRLSELREEIEEATAFHDVGRVERAEAEMDFLMTELAAAVGLGGRDRKASSDGERARQSVTRAIKGAIERISDVHPTLGAHLRTTVRTGIYSSYAPDARTPIRWDP